MAAVEAICAGRLPAKAKWVFDHYGLTPPRVKRDVYVRVRHLVDHEVPLIEADAPLVDSLRVLEASGQSSLPVRGRDGLFIGMLSPAKLLNFFLTKGDVTIPTGRAPLHKCTQVLNENDPVHDIRTSAVRNPHNHFPVVDEAGKLLGTVLKSAFAQEPPFRIILVDHNEVDQGIPGVDEVPVGEVVDHHRIAFAATKEPSDLHARRAHVPRRRRASDPRGCRCPDCGHRLRYADVPVADDDGRRSFDVLVAREAFG